MSEGSTFDNHCDQHQVMEVILRQPACKVDAATEAEGYTALHMAASKGSLQVPPPLFPAILLGGASSQAGRKYGVCVCGNG